MTLVSPGPARLGALLVAVLVATGAPAYAQSADDQSSDDQPSDDQSGNDQSGNDRPDGEARRYGQYFNGSFVEVSSRAALSRVTSSEYGGWSWDVGLRQALVMHLLDTRIAYAEDRLSPRDENASGEFVLRTVGITTGFHPLYMALLLSDWFGYVIASWYIEVGLAGQHGVVDGDQDLGLRWSIGSGLDIPVTDPDAGWSIWLNGVYRYVWSDFDFDAGGEENLYHHEGWAGLSVRFNGLLF